MSNKGEIAAHCPSCDGKEFYAELEGSCSAWAEATIKIENGKAIEVDYDGSTEDIEYDYWHTTGIIQCDRCGSDFTRDKLVIKSGDEEVDLGPQPGKGQINLLTGDVVK